jgi:hypothetical protein
MRANRHTSSPESGQEPKANPDAEKKPAPGRRKVEWVPRIIAFSRFPECPPESLRHSCIQFFRDPGHRHRGALPQLPRDRNLVGMPFPEPPELIQFHPARL